jgi:hypothetical protein
VQFWQCRPYGVDLSSLSTATALQIQPCRSNVLPEHVLAQPQMIWQFELAHLPLAQSLKTFSADASFQLERGGRCNAVAGWFEAQLSPGNVLTNEPSDQYTHWGRWVIPIAAPAEIRAGEQIDFHLEIEPCEVGKAAVRWHGHAAGVDFASADMTELVC